MTDRIDADTPPDEFVNTFHEAIRRILHGEPLPSFCDWFVDEMGETLAALASHPPDDEATSLRFQRHMARSLWHAVPVPDNRWRPRPTPKPERNGPCPCGSGRKYKQCCAQFAGEALPMPAEQLFALALTLAEPHMLRPGLARLIPAEALGHAAATWNANGQADRTIEVLEPLFEDLDGLDERHEYAFDVLMDALQDMAQEARRDALARRVAGARDRQLASAARGRLISMLADRGEQGAAWKLFHEAVRQDPENPHFWHLEVSLLLGEGRTEEAKMRATLLAARARREGLNELAQTLTDLGTHGLQPLVGGPDEDDALDGEEDEAWVELSQQAPTELDGEALAALYQVTREPAVGDEPPVLSLVPTPALAAVQADWAKRFQIVKPAGTDLMGDASALLDDLPEVAAFLQAHPNAWLCLEVLDDLLLAAAEIADPDAPRPVQVAALRLAEHAVTVLRSLIGTAPAQLVWVHKTSRPALRVLAQAILFAFADSDAEQMHSLTRWGLAICPSDPFGWRRLRAELLLVADCPAEALALIEAAPSDEAMLAFMRVLALFALGRQQEAETAIRAAHARHPHMLPMLLPDLRDAPLGDEDTSEEELGVQAVAWAHRTALRPKWVGTGALDWARGLDL